MQEPQNERKSVIMNLLSMLIFGTIGIFRRHILVSALLFSAFFLKEPLNTLGIIGAIMIIGSTVLSEMLSKKG